MRLFVTVCCWLLALISADKSPISTRQFAILMDAGSTGTRVHVFSWDSSHPYTTLREVGSTKVRIALSSLADDHSGVQSMLSALISYADTHIPPQQRAATGISLKATAGLRRLSDEDQQFLIASVHDSFLNSGYSFTHSDTSVIPGHEEALYDYMAVVVALQEGAAGAGVLDLGGASKQLSYVIQPDALAMSEVDVNGEHSGLEGVVGRAGASAAGSAGDGSGVCVPDYMLQLPGEAEPVGLVARSVQGMGLLAAMDFIVGLYVSEGQDGGTQVTPQPCMAVGETASGEIHEYSVPLQGYGNATECYELIRHHFLEKIAQEIDLDCLQKHKPERFIALDNFPKLMEMLGLVGGDLGAHASEHDAMKAISPELVLAAGHEICQLPWQDLIARFPDSYPSYRAQRACFGAAYMYFLMMDVYGISELSQGEFFPMESHNEHDLGWVLGAVAVSSHGAREELLLRVPTLEN
mmetsp:Transcript_31544/g.58720  ORF Transcript_31544/g.58720 Transcript_31544/m.58720 type:complete len:467 (-) Transcript_31544:47-1447(-)